MVLAPIVDVACGNLASRRLRYRTSGCINAYYRRRTDVDERVYASFYPYFAEYCAVSEFNKKKGLGVELEGGGPGGHSVFYLNGACRVRDAGYPVLALCSDSPDAMAGRGVGLSVNDHYENANWTATEGRTFSITVRCTGRR
jgi:hypothetical protein